MENKKKLIIIIIIDIFLLVCFIVSFYIPARKVTIRKSAFEFGGAYL